MESDWIIIPTIGEHKIHVPNHQPGGHLMLEMVTNKLNKTHIFPGFGDHVHYRLLR